MIAPLVTSAVAGDEVMVIDGRDTVAEAVARAVAVAAVVMVNRDGVVALAVP